METLKRRSNSLIHQVQQHLPSVPPLRRHANSQPSSPNPTKPRSSMRGTWERVDLPLLPRSSHSLDVVAGAAYIFGGEQIPRQPVGNDVHVVRLPCSSAGPDYYALPARPARPDEPTTASSAPKTHDAVQEQTRSDAVPAPRVGHATAVIGARIFLFGGRGGPDMQPLDEAGRVWVFDVRSHTWTFLDPVPAVIGGAIVPHPAPRSYHCATSTDHPHDSLRSPSSKSQTWRQWVSGDVKRTGTPQSPLVGNVAAEAVDEETEGYGTFFIHAGCLVGGDRANDLWAFDVRSRTWTALPAAPGPSRGGTAICISKSRLFRFGGFDGTNELGGQVDFLPLELDTFDDRATKSEVSVHARAGGWQSILAGNPDASSAEIPLVPSQAWPAARSVAAFQSLTLGGGREYLVLAMGETEPSASGHAGAGTFASDVWTFQVPPLGMSTASWTDAMLQAVGRNTGEGRWVEVVMGPRDPETDEGAPSPRGWLASAPMADVEDGAVLLFGGLGEDNERIGDGWILRLGT